MPLWQDYDAAVLRGAEAAVRAVMDKHDGKFYGIAFHEFYGETGGMVGLPCLAANTVEAHAAGGYSQWGPPNWKWTDIKFADADLKKLHRAIEKYACSEDDDDFWEAAFQRMIKSYIRAVTAVAGKLKKHKRAAPDFVGIVDTQDDEVENLKKCVTPAQFKKLFPEIAGKQQALKLLKGSPVEQKLAKYREEMFEHEEAIIKLGAAAIPMLLDKLGDEDGWLAANLLGRIGLAEPRVIAALRKRMQDKKQADCRTAAALALLGDVEHVLKLAASPSTRSKAIEGVNSLYLVDANDCTHRIPLDFRPLEKLLEIVDEKRVAASLDCSTAIEITAADVPEVLRGLASEKSAIREQALRILGERGRLDAKSGAQIVPAVAVCLTDRKASIRKLALFALAEWKKAAKPYQAEIRKCTKDRSAEVVYAAKHCLDEIK